MHSRLHPDVGNVLITVCDECVVYPLRKTEDLLRGDFGEIVNVAKQRRKAKIARWNAKAEQAI